MYEAPKVEIIEVEVEKGFAVSGGTEDYDQHPSLVLSPLPCVGVSMTRSILWPRIRSITSVSYTHLTDCLRMVFLYLISKGCENMEKSLEQLKLSLIHI